jgi:hypothetical protein
MDRERLLNESAADREKVTLHATLARFGDPAAVARGLWRDAMKEKIMAQRLMSVMVVVASAACVMCAAFMWQLVQSNRESQQSLLAAQREMLAAAIAKLQQSAVAAGPSESELWQLLRVKVVDPEGQAVAATATCSGKSFGSGNDIHQREATDAQGIADFGRLPTGQYTISVHVDSSHEFSSGTSIILGPGRPSELTIKCPLELPDPVAVHFAISPPAKLETQPLYYVIWLSPRGRSFAGQSWHSDNEGQNSGDRYVLLDSAGKVLGELSTDEAIRRVSSGGGVALCNAEAIPADLMLRPCAGFVPRTYQIMSLAAYVPADDAEVEHGSRPTLKLTNWQVPSQSVNVEAKASDSAVSEVIKIDFANADFWDAIEEKVKSDAPSTPPTATVPDS